MKRLVLLVIVAFISLSSIAQGVLDNYPASVKKMIKKNDKRTRQIGI